jgi:arylsulfatase A-like enzyme
MRRRTFLLGSLAVAGLNACGGGNDRAGGPPAPTGAVRQYGDTTLTRTKAPVDAPNVLFISIDDCNDWLGFLNDHPGTYTPNLDALAAESLVFDHAYTAAPMCLPSRTAVMFGVHPFTTGVYDHSDESRKTYDTFQKETPSLVDTFWGAGYDVYGTGKIFHDPQADRWTDSYRQAFYVGESGRSRPGREDRYDATWISPYDDRPIGDEGRRSGPVDFGPSGKSPEEDPDGLATTWAIDRLHEQRSSPFFIGHGIYLPHVPWRLPQQFFDLHPLDEVVVPGFRPEDLDDLGPYARKEIISTPPDFEELNESGVWPRAVQAYQAAISYADWCVGRVLDDLYSGPRGDDTIVVVWSDHGFHLGEKMHLHKFTLWERATRVPLVVKVPGRFDTAQRFDPPVSLLDLGATVEDLAGIPHAETGAGRSLLPLVDDPARADERPPIMTWLAGNHAVRRGQWRYIRYRTGETELYDVEADPDEFTNLSALPEHAARQRQLDELLPPPGDVADEAPGGSSD